MTTLKNLSSTPSVPIYKLRASLVLNQDILTHGRETILILFFTQSTEMHRRGELIFQRPWSHLKHRHRKGVHHAYKKCFDKIPPCIHSSSKHALSRVRPTWLLQHCEGVQVGLACRRQQDQTLINTSQFIYVQANSLMGSFHALEPFLLLEAGKKDFSVVFLLLGYSLKYFLCVQHRMILQTPDIDFQTQRQVSKGVLKDLKKCNITKYFHLSLC